jgi:hypothetical protein
MDNLEEIVRKGFEEAADEVIKYFGWDKNIIGECNKRSSYKEVEDLKLLEKEKE